MTVKGFYKQAFSEHINWLLVLAISIIIVAIYAVGVYLVSVRNGVTISSMLTFSLPAILNGFFPSVLEGATGEETGWRGFLLPSIEKKVGLIKGSLIVGVIWSFWHAPLWFLTTGYAGLELLEYIIAFIISIVSFSLIIGICYNHCHNLFIPIWMHFMFNFSLTFYVGRTVDLIVWLAVFYVLTALGFVWWHKASVHGYNPR
jgi:membrane protease YdiL (CAAX protease family)